MPEKVKLLISWDIQPDQESKTFEFMAHELAPTIQQLGITPTEAWYAVYGDRPQIVVGAVADDLSTMTGVLESPKWRELMDELEKYIHNFKQKLVPARGHFQL